MLVSRCCSSLLLLFPNTIFTKALILFCEHLFGTRDTSCGSVGSYPGNACNFLVRYTLSSTEDKRDGILFRHTCQSMTDQFSLGNLRNTAGIRKKIGRIIAKNIFVLFFRTRALR